MAFWTDVGSTDADPKRGFRWKIQFDNLAGDGESIVWFAKKVEKPNFEVTESEHSFLNHKYYWPGRVTWAPINLTLVDPVSPDAVGQTNKIIEAMGYQIPKDGNDLVSMAKGKSQSALGAVVISQLDSNGKEIEIWTLKQAWLKDVKFGELSYESDDLIEISLTLRYDWATCEINGEVFYSQQAN
mgnify:FL=1|tara:strand:+ start:464 stop:1018 length:555 start_codon:yes stop_codon:yes gene_type:complete